MKIDGILWKVRREDGRVRLYLRSEAGQVVVKMETGMAMEVARELAFAACWRRPVLDCAGEGRVNIEWRFQDGASGGAVTAFFGRCRVTQYPNGGMIATLPAQPTEEETRTRRELFERHAKTGKIWVEGWKRRHKPSLGPYDAENPKVCVNCGMDLRRVETGAQCSGPRVECAR